MLNLVIQWALTNRWLVSVLALVLMGAGLFSTVNTPVDVFPDFAPPQVVVLTEAPGFAPEEVESVITLPLEAALNSTPRTQVMRSVSTVGLSAITLIFEEGTDILQARQLVNERLASVAAQLPPQAKAPQLAPLTTVVGEILRIGLLPGTTTSAMDLRTLADWDIKQRLMSVPGVANVVIHGAGIKQYQVLVNPNALKQYDVTLGQVIQAARGSNLNMPGGVLRTPDREYLIRGLGRATSLDDIRQTVVTSRGGTPITLAQVATVQVGPGYNIGDAIINGKPGIIFTILKQPTANTLATTYGIEAALRSLKPSLPKDVTLLTTFRQADFIEVSIRNVLEALAMGGALVVAILWVFLQNWRTAFISLTAIPLSLLVAIIALKTQGGTINTMTLGGLAIAIGEVVDDAIIDVENVYRRLQENQRTDSPQSPLAVIYQASTEIRSSVVYATFIVALVFLPVFSLTGLEGKIFTPLAFSYIVAIVASLGVALTVTPALCALLLAKQAHLPHHETKVIAWLKQQYAKVLRLSLSHPKTVVLASVILFLVSLLPLAVMGKTFLPEFDESNLIIGANSMPGTSLDITTATGKVLTQHLKTHSEVLAIGQRAGRAEGSDDYGGSNFSEFDVRLSSEGDKKYILSHVREDFAKVPGLVMNVGSYISHRMDHVLSGVNAAIAIKVYGPDLPTLHQQAQAIEAVMKTVPGAVDVQVEPIIPVPQVSIAINRSEAARFGLTMADLSQTVEAAFKGLTVSKVLEQQKTFDLLVWFAPAYRADLATMQATLIDTPSGQKVPLSSVAEVRYGDSPNLIRHETMSRHVIVQANVSGRDLGGVIAEARTKIAQQVLLPQGYRVEYGGQFQAQEQATQQLGWLSGLAVVGIYLLLLMALRSPLAAGIVMANLPLALIGGIWSIFLSGGVLSVGSLVGFITLFGISTRNGIMLVSHFNQLKAEGRSFGDVLWHGSLDRLSPVLMTALTAALGVLPIALLGGAGRELEQPLAIVIVGGMVTSTSLTLLVIPALFQWVGERALPQVTTEEAIVNLTPK